jgi:PAS domain S-box-containing protein
MNEGFTGIDGLEMITIFNRQMEQLTGYSRKDIIGKHIYNLYAPESHDDIRRHLDSRRGGESSSYQTFMVHKDGHRVPVRISGAPLRDHNDRHIGAFAVVTDIREQVEAEAKLRGNNEEIARLLDRERKRAAHFAIINQVARLVLSTLDPDEIFDRIVRAVRGHFKYHHTTLFLLEDGDLVMNAQSGAYEPYFSKGYRQALGIGIVGHVVDTGEPLLANDVEQEPRRVLAFKEEANTGAELCVPVKIGSRVLGAIDVQTIERNQFDENDLTSLQILADQLAWVIHNARLYQETLQLKEFNEQVLRNTPLPIVLLAPDLRVVSANQSYLMHRGLNNEELIGRSLAEAVPDSFLVTEEGREAVATALRTGETVNLDRRTVPRGAFQNRIVDIRISRVVAPQGPPLALVVIEDLTEKLDKAYESSLLRRVGQVMQGILDLDRLLYAILTCVTAGTALRFNRAVLLLVNEDDGVIEGKIGVGPSSPDEAARIWTELGNRNLTVDDILAEYDAQPDRTESPLTRAACGIRIAIDEPDDILARAVRGRETCLVTEEDALSISPTLWSALGTHHFVAVPLVTRDRVIGLILADNLYSGAPITDDSVDLLTAFAGHAAVALDNAELYHQSEEQVREVERAYVELEHAQSELVQSERLAVIGQMSARIAHEIRNPLATIGGFAKSILKKPDPERVERAATIIVDEVTRLEALLQDTLSFTRPTKPALAATDLVHVIRDVRDLIERELRDFGVDYIEDIAPHLPTLSLDAQQMKQVLLNITQNALQAMPTGGTLTVRATISAEDGPRRVTLAVEDTGEGIKQDDLESIFSPFFTTKTYGTGLGLVISKQIVEDHGGRITAHSTLGQGTTIHIDLPVA